MTEPQTTPQASGVSAVGPSPRPGRAWKVRLVGRLVLVLCIPLTYVYVRDVPRAFSYMETGIFPPKPNVLWLEWSLRPYYLPNKSSRRIIKAALPASAIGFSFLLLGLGCASFFAGHRVKVSRAESFIWSSLGAFLLGVNAMTTWIIWKAFVFT